NSDPRMSERDLEEMREQLLRSAIAAGRTLLKGRPEAELQGQLARIESQLGQLDWREGRQEPALGPDKQTVGASDPLRVTHPGNRSLLHLKGVVHGDIGLSLQDDGQYDRALQELLRSEKLMAALVDDPGATDDHRGELARARLNMGFLYRQQKQPAKA